jgi:hypothetical protein
MHVCIRCNVSILHLYTASLHQLQCLQMCTFRNMALTATPPIGMAVYAYGCLAEVQHAVGLCYGLRDTVRNAASV